MKVNQLKAGVVLSYVGMIAQSLISIIYTPIMLRILGKSEYGLYSLVNSVVGYLGLLSFGFGSAYIRYYAKYRVKDDEEGIARLNGMFMTIYTVIGVIALIAGFILLGNINSIFGSGLTTSELDTAKVLMVLMIINIAISFPVSVFSSYVTANEQYLFQRILNLINCVLNPFLALPLLLLGYKSISLVVVSTVITIISAVTNMWYCFKKLNMKFIFKGFQFGLLKEMFVFSSYIFLNMIVDQINWSVDKFLLGRYAGTVVVAIYAVGSQINTYYLNFSTSISSVFIPKVNRIVSETNDNKVLTDLFIKVGRVQFIVLSLIFTGFVWFGHKFISMWAGSGYDDAYIIALLLIMPATIPLIQNLGIEIQRAKNMHKFRSVLYFFIAIANVFISIPLCKAYGGIGAAIGTTLSLLIGNGLIMNIYYHKKVGLDMKKFWISILKFIPSFIIPSIVGYVFKYIIGIDNVIKFVVLAIIYAIVFIVSLWIFALNEDEKNLISGPLNKIKIKFAGN